MSKEMREKFCKGYVSERFIKTGKTTLTRRGSDREEIERILEEDKKKTAKAIKNFRQWRAKRKGPEYRILFE